jgi:hypothetical protein
VVITVRCIWCREENDDTSVEHIFPDALGCPDEFKLGGGLVCRRCNNGLGHLDQVVIADFDMMIFMANIPRKKGRPPVVNMRGNLDARLGPSGPTFGINMEKHPVMTEYGAVLGAFGKSRRNVDASFTRNGPMAEISFSTTIGENPKFVRGIVKIAFASLTYFLGPAVAYHDMFNPIREFVLKGTGMRRILLVGGDDPGYRHEAGPPFQSPTSGYFATVFRLVALDFYVDLSPDHSIFPDLKQHLMNTMGANGWSQLPLDRVTPQRAE